MEMLRKFPELGMEEVVKIKKCIYEGYKLNTAIRIDETSYKSMYGKFDIVKPSSMDGFPRYFIYSDAVLRAKNDSYKIFATNYYSVLDNFVPIDISLI